LLIKNIMPTNGRCFVVSGSLPRNGSICHDIRIGFIINSDKAMGQNDSRFMFIEPILK
jgi:hypothetical protein